MVKALALTLVAALAVMGCQSDGPKPARYAPAKPVDMTGNWEVDYARSDNIQRSFNTIIRQLQQEAERRARAAERGQTYSGGPMASGRDLLCLLYTSPSPRDLSTSRMPSSA